MKNFYTALLLLVTFTGFSQTTLFHEDFNGPTSLQVTTGVVSGSPTLLGNDTLIPALSDSGIYHLQGSTSPSVVYFETPAFSTIGHSHVRLTFRHIAKLNLLNEAHLQVSTDSGQTWIVLTSQSYWGSDALFPLTGYFNSGSYNNIQNTGWYTQLPYAQPDSSWWHKEIFNLNLSGATNKGNVMLRFVGYFNGPISGSTDYEAGWFMDDIKVEGASCELIPPKAFFNFGNCPDRHPEGNVLRQSFNNYGVEIDATDIGSPNTGISSVKVFYRVNGGNWNSFVLNQIGASTSYLGNFYSILLGDVVDYYYEVKDNSCVTNTSRKPESKGFYTFTVVDQLTTKCLTPGCQFRTAMVSQFPWKEDFEGPEWTAGFGPGSTGSSHRGSFPQDITGWEVSPDNTNGTGWSVRTGPTGTPSTGPSADFTTGNGKYIYAEFEQAGPSLTATTITTPCIDLTDSVLRSFSFRYHMYGDEINQLVVDIDTGTNAASLHPFYSSIVGQQQVSPADGWKKAVISLAPVAGKYTRIRLRAIGTGNGNGHSDIAIDQLEVSEALANDMSTESATSLNEVCEAGLTLPLQVKFRNEGAGLVTSIPYAYRLDGGTVFHDTLTGVSLALGDTISGMAGQLLNPDPALAHSFEVWTELSGDLEQDNDTLTLSLPAQDTLIIDHFPYILDFEDASASATMPGSLNGAPWELNRTAQGAAWHVEDRLLNDSPEGPLQGLGRNHKMLILKGSPVLSEFVSKCMDFSSLSSPQLVFNAYIKSGRSLTIKVEEAGEAPVTVSTINGNSGFKDPLFFQSVDLSAFAGKTVKVVFEISSTGNSDWTDQVAIDNILIKETTQTDVGLFGISGQLQTLAAGSINLPTLTVNYGKTAGGTSASVLKISMQNRCNPSAALLTSSNSPVSLSSSANVFSFQNLVLSDSLQESEYLTKVWVETSGDTVHENDTLYFTTMIRVELGIPYFNGFETCLKDITLKGDLRQWEIIAPSTGAHSGNFAAVTNDDGPAITRAASEMLISPLFIGVNQVYGAELRFWHQFNFPNNSAGMVEYFDAGQWLPLPAPGSFGGNWPHPFSGNSNGWQKASYPINQLGVNNLALRFVMPGMGTSDPAANWVIDDFEIVVPPQNSASPSVASFVGNIPSVGPNTIALKIKNTGHSPLAQVDVSVSVDNGSPVVVPHTFSPALGFGKSASFTLPQPVTFTASSSELQIITSQPNAQVDGIPTDDTLKIPFVVLQPVSALPYCADFESSASFLSFDPVQGSINAAWGHSAPAKNTLNSAHSGSKAWLTAPGKNYDANTQAYLFTPPMPLDSATCYQFSFWHQYETEPNFDGGQVEFKLDNQPWQLLGNYGDTTWYNYPYVQALSGTTPGFSGSSGGWAKAFKEFRSDSAATIQFRFRFGSDAANHDEGWAIDDVCLEEISGSCAPLSLPLLAAESSVSLYPNPAGSQVFVSLQTSATGGKVSFSLFDLNGKTLRHFEETINGQHLESIDLTGLPDGVYLLQVSGKDFNSTHKFIKQSR